MPRAALAVAGLCLLSTAPAPAGTTLNGGWQQESQFETGLTSSGYGAGISFDLGRHFFVGASYSSLRTESFEDALDGVEGRLEYRSAGADLGAVWPWTQTLGVTATGGYAASTTRGLDGFHNDRPERYEGVTGSLSLWYQPSARLALNLGSGYSYLGGAPGWDTSAGVGLRVWRELWLDGGYWRGEGVAGWTAGLRAYVPAS